MEVSVLGTQSQSKSDTGTEIPIYQTKPETGVSQRMGKNLILS